VKLWPTLVFLKDGREVARLVRPTDAAAIRKALADIDA
jgi:thioredoxin 1